MTVIYTKLVGDLFHFGHVNFLRQAKALGDKLVVHVVSDERVSAAKCRPLMTQTERLAVVAACKYVDDVVSDGPIQMSRAFMDEQGYDLYVFACVDDLEAVTKKKDCGDLPDHRVVRLAYTSEISTTLLRARLMSSSETKAIS